MEQILDGSEPNVAPMVAAPGQPGLEVPRHQDAQRQHDGGSQEDAGTRVEGEPDDGPKGGVSEDAEKERDRLANADGAGPAQLMLPNLAKVQGSVPALDDHGRKLDFAA